jgi:hypothetical protein
MNPGIFRQLIEDVGDYVFPIPLSDWGEPLPNPSLVEMISCATAQTC